MLYENPIRRVHKVISFLWQATGLGRGWSHDLLRSVREARRASDYLHRLSPFTISKLRTAIFLGSLWRAQVNSTVSGQRKAVSGGGSQPSPHGQPLARKNINTGRGTGCSHFLGSEASPEFGGPRVGLRLSLCKKKAFFSYTSS